MAKLFKRKVLFLWLIFLFLIGCSFSSSLKLKKKLAEKGESQDTGEKISQTVNSGNAPSFLFNLEKKDIENLKKTLVVLKLKQGEVKIKLFPEEAPITCANFVYLTKKGFYNGTRFHRVVKNFVVQGGDPLSKDDFPGNDGTGGPGYTIPAEFNDLPHKAGTVAMARSQDPDSAGSQFYICLSPQPQLDGNYTVFGQVVAGFEVVKQIKMGEPILYATLIKKE